MKLLDVVLSIVREREAYMPCVVEALPVRVSVPLLLLIITLEAVTPVGRLATEASYVPLAIPVVVT